MINQDTTFQKLPYKYFCSLPEDRSPDAEEIIGKNIVWIIDGKPHYGHVISVENKNVRILLEKKWMRRSKWTVNWREILLAPNGSESNLSKNLERENQKNKKIEEIKIHMEKLMKYSKSEEINVNEELKNSENGELFSYFLEEMRIYNELLEELETTRATVIETQEKLMDIRKRCIDSGISQNQMPEISKVSITQKSREKEYTKKISRDKKRILVNIRIKTRFLLANLLLAVGKDGIESEKIIETISFALSKNPEYSSNSITGHRIMGMLSAFSRRGEAESLAKNKWRATEKLIISQKPLEIFE